MTDLLQQIDEGIARHHREEHGCVRDGCQVCCQPWPCETLKALQGWREAEVRARAVEAIALGGKLCISEQHADLEAKLKDAEAKVEALKKAALEKPCTLYSCKDVENLLRRVKDAEAQGKIACSQRDEARASLVDMEEKTRGLVEALEQVIAEVEYLSHRAARNISMIAREALTQAKREGE